MSIVLSPQMYSSTSGASEPLISNRLLLIRTAFQMGVFDLTTALFDVGKTLGLLALDGRASDNIVISLALNTVQQPFFPDF